MAIGEKLPVELAALQHAVRAGYQAGSIEVEIDFVRAVGAGSAGDETAYVKVFKGAAGFGRAGKGPDDRGAAVAGDG